MKVLSFKVPAALERRLAAVVRQRGHRKSTIVRMALEQYLARGPEARRGSFLDLAGDLAGCVTDAPADLSSNPRHLADFGR